MGFYFFLKFVFIIPYYVTRRETDTQTDRQTQTKTESMCSWERNGREVT